MIKLSSLNSSISGKRSISTFVLDNLIWFLNGGLFFVFCVINPGLFSFSAVESIIFMSVPLGLLVIAESIILLIGEFDLSITAIGAFAAQITVFMYIQGSVTSEWLLVAIALMCGIAIAYINWILITKLDVFSFLETLGMNLFLYGVIFAVIGRQLYNIPNLYLSFGSGVINPLGLHIGVPFLIIVVLIYHWILTRTTIGYNWYAIGSNRQAAKAVGLNVKRSMLIAFVICGILSALSGIFMTGYVATTSPTMLSADLFYVFAAVVIGGFAFGGGQGGASGAFGGIICLGVIRTGIATLQISVWWRQPILGLVLIAFIILNKYRKRGLR